MRRQNSAFKNQLRNFLCAKNHLYGIILLHLTSNVGLKRRKRLLTAKYRILKIIKTQNFITHSLPDHSRKPRAQTKQHTVTILCHNNKLTGGMCLLGFQRMYALCALPFLLSSIRLLVLIFIQRNHIKVLIFHINTFFIKQHNRHHKIN